MEAHGGALEAEVRQDSAKVASRTPQERKTSRIVERIGPEGPFMGASLWRLGGLEVPNGPSNGAQEGPMSVLRAPLGPKAQNIENSRVD